MDNSVMNHDKEDDKDNEPSVQRDGREIEKPRVNHRISQQKLPAADMQRSYRQSDKRVHTKVHDKISATSQDQDVMILNKLLSKEDKNNEKSVLERGRTT